MFNRIACAIAVALTVIVGVAFTWNLSSVTDPTTDNTPSENLPDATVVALSKSKAMSAGVDIATVVEQELRPTRIVLGRLDYDQDRHVAVKVACSGILTKMLARPGDSVTAGQVVAVVSSPELGIARSNALNRLAQRDLARDQSEWRHSLCNGVKELVGMIRDNKSPSEIEQRLKDESLGQYREKLVTAYTRSRLATQLASSSRDAATRGAISARVQQQRETELQASDAAVAAALEESLFEAGQRCKEASANLDGMERELVVSVQQLNMLLGPAAKPVRVSDLKSNRQDDLSSVALVSPIDGTVEERMLTANERVAVGDAIFTIADTSHLWAVADVRQRDWSVIQTQVGDAITFTVPAVPDQVFSAQVLIVGRRVDPSTGAAPLVAAMKQSDSRLRPGMFLRMNVPAGQPRRAIVVPDAAVVTHAGSSFVFIADGDRRFRRVNVRVGITTEGMTEITKGLQPGDRIASTGVFKLKSELLLAKETE